VREREIERKRERESERLGGREKGKDREGKVRWLRRKK
jgi:hypothetical protein